jgi:hypothetical protein
MTDGPIFDDADGFRVLPGWRVGHLVEESTTRSGLLVPAATVAEKSTEALALVDVQNGDRFWAVPTEAWRFIWPTTGQVVIAVRESQIIAEEQHDDQQPGGRYL